MSRLAGPFRSEGWRKGTQEGIVIDNIELVRGVVREKVLNQYISLTRRTRL